MEAVLQREPQFALYEAGGGKTPMKRGASGGPGAGEKAPVSQALPFPPSAPHSLMARLLQASLVGEGRVDTRGNLRPKLLAPRGAERNGVKGATWRRQPSAFGAGAGKASRVTEPQGAGSFQGTYFLWPLGTAGNGVREGAGPAGLSPTRSEHLPAQTSQRVHGLRVAERGNPLSLQPPEVGSCEPLVGSDARWPHTGNSVGKSSFPVKFKSAQPQWRAPRVLRCRASGHRQVPIPQGTLPEPGFRASTTRFAQSPDDRHCH